MRVIVLLSLRHRSPLRLARSQPAVHTLRLASGQVREDGRVAADAAPVAVRKPRASSLAEAGGGRERARLHHSAAAQGQAHPRAADRDAREGDRAGAAGRRAEQGERRGGPRGRGLEGEWWGGAAEA